MKTKLLMSIVAIGIAGLMLGAGTFAYFNDSATAKDNEFTAGGLDLELKDDDENFQLNPFNDDWDDTKATWVSPDNWMPGETVHAILNFTNPGNGDIKSMAMDFNVVSRDGNGDGSRLDEKIIITQWREHFKDTESGSEDWWYYTDIAELEGWLKNSGGAANGDGILTLAELDACNDFLGKGAPGPVTQDAIFQGGDGILLKGGNHQDYKLELTFKFAEDADGTYMYDSCELEIEFDARQNCPWFGPL